MMSLSRTTYALFYIYLRLQVGQTAPCEFDERCQCSNTSKEYVEYVDCSWKNITNIQNLPKSTVHLNVSHNLIEYTRKRFFEYAKYLSTLDLSFNRLTSITVATFNGLRKLRYLSLDNNKLVYNSHSFPRNTFRDLKSLSHLSLKNNNIRNDDCKHFPEDTIVDLTALEKLEMDACLCGDDFFGKGFHNLKKLKSLELRNNFRCAMSKFTFKNTNNLQNILLRGIGEISFKRGTFGKLRYLKHLEMSFDSEKGGIVSPVENIAKDFIHTSIETLKLGQSAIPLHTFPLYSLNRELYKNNITEICLTDNAGKEGQFPIPMGAPPRSLQILDLSNNSLDRFKFDIKNITDLILKQNLLGDFLSTDSYFEKKTDEYLSMIKFIDISQNDIKELAPYTFYSQPLLQHIDLSNNKIQDITFDLSSLLALEFLNLSRNRIKFFDETVMRTFNTLVINKQLTIDLSQNLLQCTCNTIPFLRWMIESNVLFVDPQEYSCTLEDGSIISMNPFEYKVLQLEKNLQIVPRTDNRCINGTSSCYDDCYNKFSVSISVENTIHVLYDKRKVQLSENIAR